MQTNAMKELLQVKDLYFQPFIAQQEITERIAQLGAELNEHYRGKRPLMIGILNGAFIFLADLCRECNFECDISFVRLSSYEGTESTGTIKTIMGLEEDIKGREVIIVEDIIDTGKTMHHFQAQLAEMQPASVRLVALLVKPDALQYDFPIHHQAFRIPNKFVLGYGLDYDGLGRNLKEIYQLRE
ncbi:MAG: hypoxanthine phosphoribosyltransferase [Bacteroidota bacterium]